MSKKRIGMFGKHVAWWWCSLAVVMMLGAAGSVHAAILDVNFGSDYDGLGGFTAVEQAGTWTETANAQNFYISGPNWSNAGLFTALSGENALSTTEGAITPSRPSSILLQQVILVGLVGLLGRPALECCYFPTRTQLTT